MVVRRALYLIPLFALVCAAAAVADVPLAGNIEAVKVVAQKSGEEMYLPAAEANPRDLIEYRLSYTNTGKSPLHNIAVTDPIPFGTVYVLETATDPERGSVEFSIDSASTFHAWPIRVKKTDERGEEVWVDATPDMVTHIRWTVAGDLDPESEINVSYRAIIK
jgi:uncharacterized repeat protein (TIGR01451 family)